jgi:tetratricopeptide (TPR) repeat protein
MDEEERAHNESLLQIYTGHLRQLELMAAKYGDLAVPSHVALEIAEYRRKIADLEGQLRPVTAQQKALPRHNLPPRDYERFVGRQKELAEVRRLLSSRSRAFVVTIDGVGGIGKSSLTLETAYIFVDQYAELPEQERFEAIVWVSAKRTYLTTSGIRKRHQVFRTLEDVFAAIWRVLEYPTITRVRAEDQRELVEQALRERRTLLILDNLETVDDDDLLDFLNELPDPTKAVVTTRQRIDVARPVRLTGMAHPDAIDLIVQEAPRKEVSLTQEQQEELWHRTGGVPLAIVWSLGLMGLGGSVASVLRRLSSGQSDIARFCFEESVAQIRDRDAHKLLMALSLFATDASREAVGIVADLSVDEFGRDTGLEELLRLSLVNKDGERFSLLPLTRVFAQHEAVFHKEWLNSAHSRLHEYLFDLAQAHNRKTAGGSGHHRLEQDLANLLSVIDELIKSLHYIKNDADMLQLDEASIPAAKRIVEFISNVERTCRYRGYWNDCMHLCIAATTIGREVQDVNRNARHFFELSRISYHWGDLEASKKWAQDALEEAQKAGNEEYICQSKRRLGLVALHQQDIELAARLLHETWTESLQIKNKINIAPYAAALGELVENQGDLRMAQSWYSRAIEESRQRNDLPALAVDLIHLGRVLFVLEQAPEAQASFAESLQISRDEIAQIDVAAKALHQLAVVENYLGVNAAGDHARESLDLFRRLGMKREQAEAEALLTKIESVSTSR